jgi:hypothetical protein
MVVELLDDKKLWDQFVEKSPQGTLFHMWDFLEIVEKHSRFQLLPYAIFSGNELRCIFPFFITRRMGLTVMYSPPPDSQIPYLGPAFDSTVAGLRAHKKEKILQQVTDDVCKTASALTEGLLAQSRAVRCVRTGMHGGSVALTHAETWVRTSFLCGR